MKLSKESALKVAEFLLQIKAIKLNVKKPFVWASGWKSPIYCDNRKALSYPMIRTYLRQQLVRAITEEFGIPDVIAGVATGGIPMGVLVAQDLGLPFVYVRPSEKSQGLKNQIEGVVEDGQSVVVVEDLISTGGSSMSAVEALRQAGCEVKGLVAIFTYGFSFAVETFEKAKCSVVTLSDYDSLLKQAVENSYILEKDLDYLAQWRKIPSEWGK